MVEVLKRNFCCCLPLWFVLPCLCSVFSFLGPLHSGVISFWSSSPLLVFHSLLPGQLLVENAADSSWTCCALPKSSAQEILVVLVLAFGMSVVVWWFSLCWFGFVLMPCGGAAQV